MVSSTRKYILFPATLPFNNIVSAVSGCMFNPEILKYNTNMDLLSDICLNFNTVSFELIFKTCQGWHNSLKYISIILIESSTWQVNFSIFQLLNWLLTMIAAFFNFYNRFAENWNGIVKCSYNSWFYTALSVV